MLSGDYSIELVWSLNPKPCVGCMYRFPLCRGARFGIPKAMNSLIPWEFDPEPRTLKLAEWDCPLISGGFRV